MPLANPGHLTDAQARNLVIKALRQARIQHRRADTMGEKYEREVDRLIKRKTRINASSLVTLGEYYAQYLKYVEGMQIGLSDANIVAGQF
jgi:hypothetical protein